MDNDKLYRLYFYSGNKKGNKVQGFQKAKNTEELAQRLLNKETRLSSCRALLKTKGSISSKEIVRFSNQMYSMTANGIPSSEAIHMYAEYAEEDFKFVLNNVISYLHKGMSLSESFRRTGFFSDLFCETISMGETSSKLDEAFINIKDFYESEQYIKKSIKSMLAYPVFMIGVILLVTILMSSFILPKFGEIYESMGSELPMVSQVYIRFGNFIISTWWIVILTVLALIKGYKFYRKGTLNRKNLDRFYLDIPFIGPMYSKILVTRFSNILSLYLKSGLQIQDSLLSSAKILQNYSVYDEFLRGAKMLLEGNGFFEIIDSISIFPPFYKQVVYTGEKSGDLGNSLVKLAKTIGEETKDTLNATSKTMSQLMLIVVCIFLAPAVIAILVPVFKVTTIASEAGGL